MAINVTQLRTFLAVAETGGFTAAARRLNVAQPALTRQIRDLEQAWGVVLFSRAARGARLTPEGRELQDAVRRAFDELQQVEGLLASLGRRVVRVHAVPNEKLGELIHLAGERFPGLRLEIEVTHYADIVRNLRENRCDIGMTTLEGDEADLRSRELARYPFHVHVPHAHRFARLDAVPLAALAEERLILAPRSARSRQVLDALFAKAGIAPVVAFEVQPSEMLLDFAGRGLGVAVLSFSTSMGRSDLVALPFVEGLSIPLHLVAPPEARQSTVARRVFEVAAGRLASSPALLDRAPRLAP